MQLNYLLFPACGKDSVRITRFLHGSSEQPVSVKPGPNTAGYSLEAVGTNSQYPISYKLKFVGGKQPAAGECEGGTAALADWDAQTDGAVLIVHMLDDTKNNIGCDLVVNKK